MWKGGSEIQDLSYFCNGRWIATRPGAGYGPRESDYAICTSEAHCPRQMIGSQRTFPVRKISRILQQSCCLKFS